MVLRIIYVLLITLILPDLYLYIKFFARKRRRLWVYILAFAPNILLLLAALLLALNESHTPANMKSMLVFFNAYMLVALPKTFFMIADIFATGIGLLWKKAKKVLSFISMASAIALFAILLAGMTFGPSNLKVKHIEYESPDLPLAFDGYRIVQFTDMHLTSFRNRPHIVDKVVDAILAQKADMIVFTGDLVSTDVHEFDGFEEPLSRLWATDGVYSVMGNHDYITYARYLSPHEQALQRTLFKQKMKTIGWQLLLNEHRIIRHGTDSIAIIGVENDGTPPFPERGDLKKALGSLPGYKPQSDTPTLFKILLSHDPTHWRRKVLPQTDIQLTLSGHTHGMQFMLFGWSPSQLIYPEWGGIYSEDGRSLNVSLGVGGALLPFRFGAWPEINVITLHKK